MYVCVYIYIYTHHIPISTCLIQFMLTNSVLDNVRILFAMQGSLSQCNSLFVIALFPSNYLESMHNTRISSVIARFPSNNYLCL